MLYVHIYQLEHDQYFCIPEEALAKYVMPEKDFMSKLQEFKNAARPTGTDRDILDGRNGNPNTGEVFSI